MLATQELLPISPPTAPAKPFLKWAGGKSRLVPILLRIAPAKFKTYFEPFLGGGAFFWALQPAAARLNDLNEELIHCYSVVRDSADALFSFLSTMRVSEDDFYEWRDKDPLTLPSLERAARLIYLNKTCFNGLYRVNKQGRFNTPFGNYESVRLADLENLRAASAALQSAVLACTDYKVVLEQAQAGDFIYLDPPYVPVGKFSDFKRYTSKSFYGRDQEQLADLFRVLDSRGCFLLLSNSYHETTELLYSGFKQTIVSMPRFVNCKGDKRGEVRELLISNYEHAPIVP